MNITRKKTIGPYRYDDTVAAQKSINLRASIRREGRT